MARDPIPLFPPLVDRALSHLAPLDEFLDLLLLIDRLERMFLARDFRFGTVAIADRAYLAEDAGTLDALREPAQEICGVLVFRPFDFYIHCHRWGENTTRSPKTQDVRARSRSHCRAEVGGESSHGNGFLCARFHVADDDGSFERLFLSHDKEVGNAEFLRGTHLSGELVVMERLLYGDVRFAQEVKHKQALQFRFETDVHKIGGWAPRVLHREPPQSAARKEYRDADAGRFFARGGAAGEVVIASAGGEEFRLFYHFGRVVELLRPIGIAAAYLEHDLRILVLGTDERIRNAIRDAETFKVLEHFAKMYAARLRVGSDRSRSVDAQFSAAVVLTHKEAEHVFCELRAAGGRQVVHVPAVVEGELAREAREAG